MAIIWTPPSQGRNRITLRYEPLQPFLFASLTEWLSDPVVVDIGANVGFYSLMSACSGSCKSVLALEPEPIAFRELRNNIRLNGQENKISVVRAAASETSGVVAFRVAGPMRGINSVAGSGLHSDDRYEEHIEVPSLRVDTLLETCQSSLMIKVDVEGFEQSVLLGLRDSLSRLPCCVQVEEFNATDDTLSDYMRGIGLTRIFRLGPDSYYSNIGALEEPILKARLLERAANLMLGFLNNTWPDFNKTPQDFFETELELSTQGLSVAIIPIHGALRPPLEVCFQLRVENNVSSSSGFLSKMQYFFPLSEIPHEKKITLSVIVREMMMPTVRIQSVLDLPITR